MKRINGVEMKKPEMILFDYGGTLVTEPQWDYLSGEKAVFKHIIKNPRCATPQQLNDFSIELFPEYEQCRRGGFEPVSIQQLKYKYAYFNIEFDTDYEEIQQILWNHTSKSVPLPHIEELLDYLNESGIRTGIISNTGWTETALKHRLSSVFPNHRFEFVIVSSEYGFRKPNKRLFNLAVRKACLNPDAIWYCGDDVCCDIQGAFHSGMFPILYENERQNENPYARKADVLELGFDYLHINDWREMIEVL